MLSYFRYFAIISFLLVLAGAFFAGIYFRDYVADVVIRVPAQEHGEHMAKEYTTRVWCRYAPVFAKIEPRNAEGWKQSKYFSSFDKANSLVLGLQPAAKVILMDGTGTELFSTNASELVFFEQGVLSGAEAAKKRSFSSRIVPSMGYKTEAEGLTKGTFVQVLTPISAADCPDWTREKGSPPVAFMEIYKDITTPWERLSFFQMVVSSGIVGTFLVLYLALFISSRKAEHIIQKQHEENLALTRAKAMAESKSKEKSMFLANVSHELRTPLNAVIGFSEIIKDEVLGPIGNPQYKEYINDINSSGVHLLSLINDILDYSKAEAQKLDVEAVEVDLTKISQSCMRMVEPRAKQAKVSLNLEAPEKHLVLTADPKRLKQVILNLLSNAVKFTPEEGQVSLVLKDETMENRVLIIVRDTGIGIAPKDISKALAPFGQVDSALSRRYEGTGLGLPLTKKLTEIMGGTFDIQSEVGLGTTVTLIFPLSRQQTKEELGHF